MPQIINESTLGGNLGTGLGQGLQLLAQHKMSELTKRQTQSKSAQLWKSLGLPADVADSIAAQPESIQKALLDRVEGAEFATQPQPAVSPTTEAGTSALPQPTGARIGPNPMERRHREQLAAQYEKINAPIIKDIREKSVPARQAVELSDNLLKILKTGKVKTGLRGLLTPNFLQSQEGQEFLSGINQLVLLKAQLGKGVPTKLRLTLEQLSKPDVWQKPKTIENLLTKMRNDPEVQKAIAESEALQNILGENEAVQPKNLRALVNRETDKLLKTKKESLTKESSFTKETLPLASNYKEGQRARNPDTGEYEYIIRNGKWEKI